MRTLYADKIRHTIEKSKSLKILMNLHFFLAKEFKNTDIFVVKNFMMSMKNKCLSLISWKGKQIKY